jgi:hypothetical protein
MESKEVNIAEIIYREDLYPRIKADPVTIQKYAESIEFLPPIEINQHNELIDGFHRLKAHQKNEAMTIRATITETKSDAELLTLAIQRNAIHGLQLSRDDKRKMAVNIYAATPERERKDKKTELSTLLSISGRTLYDWLRDIDKATNEARDKKVFDMHLACYTQEEIGEAVGLSQKEISKSLEEIYQMANLPKGILHASNYELEDDSLPKFTVWAFGEKTNKVGHFGNSEQTFIDWLTYLYTNPFDIVVDPFAGGGATIDVCQNRLRRYWVSDRKPIIERDDIRKHDLVSPEKKIQIPDLRGRWNDVKLVYLDPPYWWQSRGEYSDDQTDLANMSLEDFHTALSSIINAFAAKAGNAHIALLMQPTQWASGEDHRFIDHVLEIAPQIKSRIATRIQAPYQKNKCTPPMYKWAEENKKILVLSREIVVWGPRT